MILHRIDTDPQAEPLAERLVRLVALGNRFPHPQADLEERGLDVWWLWGEAEVFGGWAADGFRRRG